MDPLTWVYLALLAAGTAAQDQAVRKVDRETAKAQAENRDIRDKREKDSKALAQDSENAVLQTKEKQAQRAQELAAQYQTPQRVAGQGSPDAGILDPIAPGASQRTIENANRGFAARKSDSDQAAALRGQMDSYGSVMQDAGTTLSNNAADVRRNEKSIGDWTNYVLPLKLAAAQQSGRNWSTTGDVLKLAAMVTGMSALAKAPEAAAPSTVETPNIGAQIAASKGPSWMAPGESFAKYTPQLAGDGLAHFGSSFGQAAAQKGWLDAWGLGEPMTRFGPLKSAFAPATPYTGGTDIGFNPLSWIGKPRKFSPMMY